jgi:hypothetical protein
LLASRHGDPLRIEAASNPADPDSDLYETGALLPGPDATLAGADIRGVAGLHALTSLTSRGAGAVTYRAFCSS